MSFIEQTLCLVHTFSNRHVCSWRHFLGYLYSRFFPFLIHTKIFFSLHCISFIFVRLFCKLSSSGSSDPYHFGGTRSVLSWETIVHYPRYKLKGQIRLKDTTLSLGSGQHYHLFVFVLLLQVFFFYFWFLNEHRNNTINVNQLPAPVSSPFSAYIPAC